MQGFELVVDGRAIRCVYLALTLSADTWLRFLVWMALGIGVYELCARRSSAVGVARDA